jgi:hypothetical protein
MPGNLLHVSATVQCTHGASASIVSTNQRVTVGGLAVATMSDTTTVAGCTFQVPIGTGTKPQPCVTVQWSVPATRVKVNGVAPLVKTSQGLCQSAEKIPQGTASIAATQTRVTAT